MKLVIVAALVLAASMPAAVHAQVSPDVWRTFAEKVEPGTELTVRLNDGTRFRAALVAARDEGLVLQPKTRRPVPVQVVPYDAVASLERREKGGIGAGKAAAIGIATGAAAFFTMFFIAIAIAAD